jgi:CRISPR/Cas system-associated exonuclease Cas4 (RecB family)
MDNNLESLIGKQRKQIHQSQVEMISRCGISAEFRYVAGIKRRPKTFLICGTAVDRGVGTDLTKKKDFGELESEDVLCDVARDAIESYPEKEDLIPEDDEKGKPVADIIGATKDKAVRLVKAHHGNLAPVIQPVAVNQKFSINLDKWLRGRAREFHEQADKLPNGQFKRALDMQARYLNVAARDGMDFVGEFDIREQIANESVIRDTKTSKKSPSSGTADESHQLSAYSAAAYVLDGKLPDKVKLDYLVDLKGGTKTLTLESRRDMKDVEKYLNRLVPTITAFQSGIFQPAPDAAWWCDERYCAYHEICPHVHHPQTVIGSSQDLIQIGENNVGQ